MKIGILVYPECVNFATTGMYSILNHASSYLKQKKLPSFELCFISSESEQSISFPDGISIHCTRTIHDDWRPNIILVPGLGLQKRRNIPRLKYINSWLESCNEQGTIIAVSCTGIFLLAESKLLKDKKVTSHWKVSNLLKELYAFKDVDDKRIIIDHNSIIISGGTGIFMNLTIYILERFFGREVAVETADFFMIDINKYPQSSYSNIFMPRKHTDENISKAEEIISHNKSESVSVEMLAEEVCMSTRNFTRKFKQTTGYSPKDYIQRKKIRQACEDLVFTSKTVDEICFSLGYSDTASFRKLFKKYMGVTAMVYRERYCQQIQL